MKQQTSGERSCWLHYAWFFESRILQNYQKGFHSISFLLEKDYRICPRYLSAFWFTRKFSLKNFLWTGRMQFWEVSTNLLPDNPKTFAQRTKRIGNFFSIGIPISLKYSSWQVKCTCDNPAEKCPTKWRKGFAQYAESMKFFKRMNFPYVPLGALKVVLRTLPRNFRQPSEVLTLIIQISDFYSFAERRNFSSE